MMRPACLLLIVGAATLTGRADEPLPSYIGAARCSQCHAPSASAAECPLPPVPKHADAFAVLRRDVAREIAAFSGEPADPAESVICRGCHGTGAEEGRRWWADGFDASAGVQCEACHGPGSVHAEHPHEQRLRSIDRSVCTSCHRPLPSHDLVLRDGVRRAPADATYKTPVDLAVSPDGRRLFVACTQSDSVVVVDRAAGTVVREIPVGRRPAGIALSPDGQLLFVSARLDDSLAIIDTDTLQVVNSIAVGDEPHGLRASADGRWLFVLNTGEDSISVIDCATHKEIRPLTAGCGPWRGALLPDGSLAVTHVRPQPARFQQPHASEIALVAPDGRGVRKRITVPDANMLKGIAVVPAGPHAGTILFTLARTKNLIPATRLAQGWVMTHGLGVLRGGVVDQVLLDQPVDALADLNDLAVSPDGRYAAVTSGGTDRVAIVDVERLIACIDGHTPTERRDILPNLLALSDEFVVKRIAVGANPRGCSFSPDGTQVFVANALDDSVSVIDTSSWQATKTIALGATSEVTELRRGARLFHSADIAFGRQFSCQSCHPDGHINGLTMDIEADGVGLKPVDNRTLRGIVDTGPFKWEGTNPSLARQCGARLAVFFTRREPYTPQELQALVRYECTIERPPNRHRSADGLTSAQYRGKVIFERTRTNAGTEIPPAQRCTACHNGPYKTAQNRSIVRSTVWFDSWVNLPLADESMFDSAAYGDLGIFYFADAGVPPELLDAPHLTNVYDAPPYLHSGAAATLEEIWTRYNYVGGHGFTTDLTRRQFNDLMAYLRSL
ncbi:MAG TPA: beta-propeller fold lactonase family protein [Phycisphaerae bacterium]|nr:beta-propeller fold lactonase family protein [Phycisphaerae bacterium]